MRKLIWTLAVVGFTLIVAGCLPADQVSGPSSTTSTGETGSQAAGLSADAVATQVAAAILAERTQAAVLIANEVEVKVATAVAAELTRIAEEIPTATTQPLATGIPTAIPRQETPTPTNTLPAVVNPAVDYLAKLVEDVTIPDGSKLVLGEKFTKTWRIQNTGKLDWTTDFAFVFVNGSRMEGTAILLPSAVPSGGTIDISIDMQVPNKTGSYVGYWGLQTPDRKTIFGIGETGKDLFLVAIEAVAPTATPTNTPATPAATPTP